MLARFEASGETMARFCAKHRIPASTFKWWRWRRRAEGGEPAARREVRLIAVDLKAPAVPLAAADEELVGQLVASRWLVNDAARARNPASRASSPSPTSTRDPDQ